LSQYSLIEIPLLSQIKEDPVEREKMRGQTVPYLERIRGKSISGTPQQTGAFAGKQKPCALFERHMAPVLLKLSV
jgi:hypothetical protein